MAEQTEIELIERILAGDKGLYELLIRKYNQRLYRTGMSILKNETEAEDAMQTSYVKAYEHLSDFANRSSFGTWLTRIMINECLQQKKNKSRFQTVAENQYQNISQMHTPVHALINKELGIVLEDAIAGLPEKYRLVFILREIEDLSIRETANVLLLEESNIKVRLNRAKTLLRENLTGYMKENVFSFHLSRCDRIVQEVFKDLQIDYPSAQA